MHAGIDFGAKLAGTTAICYSSNNTLKFLQCSKNKDADKFIYEFVSLKHPQQLFIDAPLSLPGKYTGNGTDYFYRKADKDLNAMSPMFLGGLTARAIKLTDIFSLEGIICKETYPAALSSFILQETEKYKKDSASLPELAEKLNKILPCPFAVIPKNWHQFDSALCWLSGYRVITGQASEFGDPEEGMVYV